MASKRETITRYELCRAQRNYDIARSEDHPLRYYGKKFGINGTKYFTQFMEGKISAEECLRRNQERWLQNKKKREAAVAGEPAEPAEPAGETAGTVVETVEEPMTMPELEQAEKDTRSFLAKAWNWLKNLG